MLMGLSSAPATLTSKYTNTGSIIWVVLMGMIFNLRGIAIINPMKLHLIKSETICRDKRFKVHYDVPAPISNFEHFAYLVMNLNV
jgi:hypothetical protein